MQGTIESIVLLRSEVVGTSLLVEDLIRCGKIDLHKNHSQSKPCWIESALKDPRIGHTYGG